MKKTVLAAAAILIVAPALFAQGVVQTMPHHTYIGYNPGLSIGPRVSSYGTNIDYTVFTLETGQQISYGVFGEYRTGVLVFDFNYDHDPENSLQFQDFFPIDLERYSRDRGEVTVGWAPIPWLDFQGGFRFDTVALGGTTPGGAFFDNESLQFRGIGGGIKVHTAINRPFGVYGLLRGYTGSMDFSGSGLGSNVDANTVRFEGGFVIPIGQSHWTAVPGLEYEGFNTENRVLSLDTNRFFVNVMYHFY